jgi:hypothetical protein
MDILIQYNSSLFSIEKKLFIKNSNNNTLASSKVECDQE